MPKFWVYFGTTPREFKDVSGLRTVLTSVRVLQSRSYIDTLIMRTDNGIKELEDSIEAIFMKNDIDLAALRNSDEVKEAEESDEKDADEVYKQIFKRELLTLPETDIYWVERKQEQIEMARRGREYLCKYANKLPPEPID